MTPLSLQLRTVLEWTPRMAAASRTVRVGGSSVAVRTRALPSGVVWKDRAAGA